jgi:hypothetical protein
VRLAIGEFARIMAKSRPIVGASPSRATSAPCRPTGSPVESGAQAWFAVWTRSRHEARVRDQLVEKGVDTFLPTVARWSRWKDRKKRIDWPLE